MRILHIYAIMALLAAPLAWPQVESFEAMVAKALRNPGDEQAISDAIWALNQNAEPWMIPAFKELFQRVTKTRQRQILALTLLRHGEKDQVYFDELANKAREAITSTAPYPLQQDSEGKDIKGRINPAFVDWCEQEGSDLKPCLATVVEYAADVLLLAQAKDQRALPLLRQALGVTFSAIVAMAVRGLAWLGDTDSIPVIVANLARFPRGSAQSIAAALAEFDDPRIGPLLDRYVTNQKWRQELEETIRKRRAQGK